MRSSSLRVSTTNMRWPAVFRPSVVSLSAHPAKPMPSISPNATLSRCFLSSPSPSSFSATFSTASSPADAHPVSSRREAVLKLSTSKAVPLFFTPVPCHKPDHDPSHAMFVLHGLLGCGLNWRTLAKRMVAPLHGDIYLVDLRNHGQSDHSEDTSYEAMAHDLYYLFKQNKKLERVTLFGHSMGGALAMKIALDHPEIVERLVVVDVAPINHPSSSAEDSKFSTYFDAMRSLPLSNLRSKTQATEFLLPLVKDPVLCAFLITNLVKQSPSGEGNGGAEGAGEFQWRCNIEALAKHVSSIRDFESLMTSGKRFEGPTLFVRGSKSEYVPSSAEPRIKELFPKAKIATVEDAGHWVHFEQPHRFLKTVTPFLSASASYHHS